MGIPKFMVRFNLYNDDKLMASWGTVKLIWLHRTHVHVFFYAHFVYGLRAIHNKHWNNRHPRKKHTHIQQFAREYSNIWAKTTKQTKLFVCIRCFFFATRCAAPRGVGRLTSAILPPWPSRFQSRRPWSPRPVIDGSTSSINWSN